ncbi:MAG TPA: Hsp70 family protein [Candidatus Paceibacterota bacterium]|nr:Hsp70 family protein [Candidatus Paceibacterota bacterium]
MSIAFGLDFGTTNSVLAVSQNGSVEIVDIDPSGASKKTLKSVLFFDEEGDISIGQEAIDQYIGYGGRYGRFMQSIKAFLPSKNFKETYVFGKRYEIEDLIAIILKAIKHRGELHVGHVVDTVVLGRPVVFSDDKEADLLAEERLRTAAMRSGFANVHFLYEPIAATLAYESRLADGEEKVVFMGDFGGGTSDFAVMKLRGGRHDLRESRKKDILAVGGVYVAGDSFDSSIMWHKVTRHFGRGSKIYGSSSEQILDVPISPLRTLCQWHMISQLRDRQTLQMLRSLRGVSDDDRQKLSNLHTLIIENLGYMLFRSVEKAKRELSDGDYSVIDFSEKNLVVREGITRAEFEAMADDKFQEISKCVDATLSKASITVSEINSVILTGGSSFIPRIRRIFSDKFGKSKLLSIDAFTSVAYGLGLNASIYEPG